MTGELLTRPSFYILPANLTFSQRMRIRAVLAFTTVCSVVALALPAMANPTGRYYVRSTDASVREQHAARHLFAGGFSADLTDGEVKSLTARGIELEPMVIYTIEAKPEGKPGPSVRKTPTDQVPWGIEKLYGGSVIPSGGAGVEVAMLDTGANVTHPDLKRRVTDCKDFTGRTVKNSCADSNGHGTHTAGTVAADGGADGLGVYGMAPGANLMIYKVCGASFCWSDDIAAAIRAAADNGAEIISMSLGADTESSLERDAIAYAVSRGVLVVAAAGNDGPADGTIDYPGANPDVVAVGAIDASETVASWSSRGVNDGDYVVEAREVELGAPGVAVESTWNDGGYNVISGTSMATPHVAGLAAKAWQGSGAATRAYLQSLARDIHAAGDDTATGFGLPDLP
jgi:subtilisin